jgi:hypothetical protein
MQQDSDQEVAMLLDGWRALVEHREELLRERIRLLHGRQRLLEQRNDLSLALQEEAQVLEHSKRWFSGESPPYIRCASPMSTIPLS